MAFWTEALYKRNVEETRLGNQDWKRVESDGDCRWKQPFDRHLCNKKIKLVQPTLELVRIPQKRGRPRFRLKELVADQAFHSQEFRRFLRKRGIKPTIPLKKNSRKRKGRPVAVSDGIKLLWKIERCFAWMDNYR
jgi:hypothetical protein